jgi:hypothetical protein
MGEYHGIPTFRDGQQLDVIKSSYTALIESVESTFSDHSMYVKILDCPITVQTQRFLPKKYLYEEAAGLEYDEAIERLRSQLRPQSAEEN